MHTNVIFLLIFFLTKMGECGRKKNRGFDENINPKYEKENLPQVICFGLR
jgi:hypothetical protein